MTIFAKGREEALTRFLEAIKDSPKPAIVKTFEEKLVAPKPSVRFFTI